MTPRNRSLATALVGMVIGLAALAVISASAEQWYATPLSPLVLVLCPGLLVSLLIPGSSGLYLAFVVLVQAATYGLAALAIRLLLQRTPRRGEDAV